MAKLKVDVARRVEIGAKRRSKTRTGLLDAARRLLGREAGRDVLLGTGLAAANTLLSGGTDDHYISQVATAVLKALGVPDARARQLAKADLPELSFQEPG